MEEIEKQFAFLYNLPKYDKQMEYIDNIKINNENSTLYLEYLDKMFKHIPSNRRDKFYYMLSRIVRVSDFNVFYLITDLEIRNCFLRMFIEYGRFGELKESEIRRLEEYVGRLGYLSTKEILSKK